MLPLVTVCYHYVTPIVAAHIAGRWPARSSNKARGARGASGSGRCNAPDMPYLVFLNVSAKPLMFNALAWDCTWRACVCPAPSVAAVSRSTPANHSDISSLLIRQHSPTFLGQSLTTSLLKRWYIRHVGSTPVVTHRR